MIDLLEKVGLTTKVLQDGEPCSHIGCLSHLNHPCERCGRIAGKKLRIDVRVDCGCVVSVNIPLNLPVKVRVIDFDVIEEKDSVQRIDGEDAYVDIYENELTVIKSDDWMMDLSRTSNSAIGELCSVCRKPADRKIAEEILSDDPIPHRHPLTHYVCNDHFSKLMGLKPWETP